MRLFPSVWLLVACCFLFGSTPALAQDEDLVIFDDNFTEDPAENDWILLYAGTFGGWVPPESAYCETGPGNPDPAAFLADTPCTLYSEEIIEDQLEMDLEEFGGYVLVTPPQNSSAGAVFRSERALYDNVKMEITVELRDGSIGQPADGMTVVVLGAENPPTATGGGGGGMAATGMGSGPTMIFEFDDWSCNFEDFGDDNHVAFAWSATGFNAGDAINVVDETFSPFPEPRLHNREPAPASPNRYKMTVYIQGSTVACDLEALDQPELNDNLGRMYTYTIPDFPDGGFEGYLGVTASTGGASQNHLLHHAKLSNLPEGFCLQPPGVALRDVQTTRTAENNCGDWADGDQFPVSITLQQIRGEVLNDIGEVLCNAASTIVLKENLPPNWDGFDISDGGTIDRDTGTITWVLEGADAVEGKVVSYMCEAIDNGNLSESFSGRVQEGEGLDFERIASATSGESTVRLDTPFDLCGGITCWNILGTYMQSGGAAPGQDLMRQDFLTDGDTSELDFVFFPGAQISTDYNNSSAAGGLFDDANGRNVDGVPTVFGWNDGDSFIDLNEIYGGDPNNVMAYTQFYVNNISGDDIETSIGVSSDDSVQVIINGEEVWINSVARGAPLEGACSPQDIAPDFITFLDPIILEPGLNTVMLKTYEGGGGFNCAFRFQDEFGLELTEDLEITKYPPGICAIPPITARRSVATDDTASIELASYPAYTSGSTYDVTLTLSNVRTDGDCGAAESVTLTERVPLGWTISNVSDGGTVNESRITWRLEGDTLAEGTRSYQATAADGNGDAYFAGKILEFDSIIEFATTGDSRLANPSDLAAGGFFRKWLLLGPYAMPTGFGWGAQPRETNMQADFMTDGLDITELTVEPVPGDTVDTDYAVAISRGLGVAMGDATDIINPDRTPTWFPWVDGDSIVNFDDYYGGNLDNNMMYAVIYLNLEDDMSVDMGVSSDDSVQVLLNGEEIWLNRVARGWGGDLDVQDVISSATVLQLDPLEAGLHQIMVKTFEGGGGHGFHLRLQDSFTGEPITEGFSLCFSPDPDECDSGFVPPAREICGNDIDDDGDGDTDCADSDCPACPEICNNGADDDGDGDADCDDTDCADAGNCQGPAGPTFVRGDANSDGAINLTDGVVPLLFLFSGGAAPACGDAADTNDTGSVEITDAIIIFSWLFTGGAAPAAPSPLSPGYSAAECDSDPTEDGLGCERPSPVCP
jgi:hypothetical protein